MLKTKRARRRVVLSAGWLIFIGGFGSYNHITEAQSRRDKAIAEECTYSQMFDEAVVPRSKTDELDRNCRAARQSIYEVERYRGVMDSVTAAVISLTAFWLLFAVIAIVRGWINKGA